MGQAAYSQCGYQAIPSSHWAMRTAARVPGLARGKQIGRGPRQRPPRAAGFSHSPVGRGPIATRAAVVKRVLLASPRGFCAGVERAVETVELALEHYGAPVYVRHQIVHNAHVVRDLEARGAVFVENEIEAPEGATIVFSAHGVAPAVFERSA